MYWIYRPVVSNSGEELQIARFAPSNPESESVSQYLSTSQLLVNSTDCLPGGPISGSTGQDDPQAVLQLQSEVSSRTSTRAETGIVQMPIFTHRNVQRILHSAP